MLFFVCCFCVLTDSYAQKVRNEEKPKKDTLTSVQKNGPKKPVPTPVAVKETPPPPVEQKPVQPAAPVQPDYLNVQENVSFEAEDNLRKIPVGASADTWTIDAPYVDWVEVWREEEENLISVECLPNKAITEREYAFVVKLGGEERTVLVTQSGAAPYLRINTESLLSFPAAGAQKTIAVSTNLDEWDIAGLPPSDLFEISKDSDHSAIHIIARNNGKRDENQAEFTLTAGTFQKRIRLHQNGIALDIDLRTKSFGTSGGEQIFRIQTDNAYGWTIPDERLPDGFSIKAKDQASITLVCTENLQVEERLAVLKIQAGDVTDSITITQAAAPVNLVFYPQILEFKRSGKPKLNNQVTITTNAPQWTISSTPGWARAERNGSRLLVTVDKNVGSERNEYLSVTAKDNIYRFVIKQDRGKRYDTKVFLEYRLSESAPIGGFLGIAKRAGVYVSFRASASLLETGFEDLDRLSFTAGPMVRLASWLFLYAGVGYGEYYEYYDSYSSSSYTNYIDASGMELEGGAKLVLGVLSLSAGYSYIPESGFGELHAGVGFAF
jgi:hypothetical protein